MAVLKQPGRHAAEAEDLHQSQPKGHAPPSFASCSEAGLRQLARLPLRSLILSACCQLTDSCLLAIAEGMPNLSCLGLFESGALLGWGVGIGRPAWWCNIAGQDCPACVQWLCQSLGRAQLFVEAALQCQLLPACLPAYLPDALACLSPAPCRRVGHG